MDTVSKEYQAELEKLHSSRASFGLGRKIPRDVRKMIKIGSIKSVLDYGCGKGKPFSQWENDKLKVFNYDPVTSPIELPDQVDLVHSNDVLEHVEPGLLQDVIDKFFSIGQKYQYHLIACHPAKKKLSDGRNAHLIIEQPDWWRAKIKNPNWKIIHEEVINRTVQPKKC